MRAFANPASIAPEVELVAGVNGGVECSPNVGVANDAANLRGVIRPLLSFTPM